MAIQIDRAIFLHIPKTGGTWITNYFKETGMDHGVESLAEHAHINGVGLNDIIGPTEDLVFCFVRHPLTWFRSYWQCKQALEPRQGGYLDTIVDQPFNKFIDDILQDFPGYMTNFVSGYTQRCRLIGKQENLRSDLDEILTLLRIDYDRTLIFNKPPVNKIETEEKYTMTQAFSIMKTEKPLIDVYGYNYIPSGVVNEF